MTALSGYGADGLRSRYYPGNPTASQGTVYCFSYDPQGNVTQRHTPSTYASILGPSPALDTQFYDAFGALRQDYGILTTGHSAPSHKDPVGFGGQYGYYTDTETGLLCLTHRYYDPGTGKFINRDPIGYDGGINLYGFCEGNPVNESDPDGTDGLDWWANFASGVGDSLTFGSTHWARLGVGKLFRIGDPNEGIDTKSGAYVTGEYIETGFEVVVSLGSVGLTKAALKQGAKQLARREFRSMTRNIIRNGKSLHHINPLAGHPVNITKGRTVMALFPMQGLPSAIHSAGRNLKLLDRAPHMAAHLRMIRGEKLLRVGFNRYTTTGRIINNARKQ